MHQNILLANSVILYSEMHSCQNFVLEGFKFNYVAGMTALKYIRNRVTY